MEEVFPGGTVVKNQPADAGDRRDKGSIPGLIHRRRALATRSRIEEPGSYRPLGSKESDTTEAT